MVITYAFDLHDGEEITCCYDCPLCYDLIFCELDSSIHIDGLTREYNGQFPDKCPLRVSCINMEV